MNKTIAPNKYQLMKDSCNKVYVSVLSPNESQPYFKHYTTDKSGQSNFVHVANWSSSPTMLMISAETKIVPTVNKTKLISRKPPGMTPVGTVLKLKGNYV